MYSCGTGPPEELSVARIAVFITVGFMGLLLAVSASGSAGSRGNPEIADPKGDTHDTLTNMPVSGPGVADIDLLAVWFSEAGGGNRYEIQIRVADVVVPGQFRDGVTVHHWAVSFETGGLTFRALIFRDVAGATFGGLDVVGINEAGETSPRTDKGTATLEFRASLDEIILNLPRRWTVNVAGSGPRTFDFPDGTTLRNAQAQTFEGRGSTGAACNFPCSVIDFTGTGHPFTFGRGASASNDHLRVRPDQSAYAVEPGQGVDVGFWASGAPGAELTANLTASIDRPGWIVTPAVVAINTDAQGQARAIFRVKAPSGALPGEIAVLTVEGGAQRVQTLVAVGSEAAQRFSAGLRPSTDDLAARTETFYLQGSTRSFEATPDRTRSSSSDPAIFPGNLVEATSAGNYPHEDTASFSSDRRRIELGEWRTAPLLAPATAGGDLEVQLNGAWSGVTALKLLAVVGPSPLPLSLTGTTAPPGTVLLQSAAASTSTGSGVLVANGHTQGIAFGPGDRIGVSLFLETTGTSGTATAKIYTPVQASLLSITLQESVQAPRPAAAPGAKTAVVAGGIAPSVAGLGSAPPDATARIAPSAGPAQTLAPARIPQTVTVGNFTDQPATLANIQGQFSGTDANGARKQHTIRVGPNAVRLDLELKGSHASDATRTVDNQLGLELFFLNGTTALPVKSAHGFGPERSFFVGHSELARFGPGNYRVDAVATSKVTPVVSYTLKVTAHDSVRIPDGFLSTPFVWNLTGLATGDYTVTVTYGPGTAAPKAIARTLRLTDLGPTFPPIARFNVSATLVPAGQRINFTDLSVDPDGTIARRTWDFGDGATSNETNPSHGYAAAGVYPVKLTVEDEFRAVAVSRPRTITVLALPAGPGNVTTPNATTVPQLPEQPTGGTLAHYRSLYLGNLPHQEAYPAAWRQSELEGQDGTDYLPARSGRPAYVYGHVPAVPSDARWDAGGVVVASSVGAQIDLRGGLAEFMVGSQRVLARPPSEAQVGGQRLDLRALAIPDPGRDTFDDGILEVESHADVAGVASTRTLRVLEGALHTDARTHVRATVGTSVRLTNDVSLPAPAGAWVATVTSDGIIALPVNAANGLVFQRTGANLWFAVYHPNTTQVAGAVLAGDTRSALLTLSGTELVLTVERQSVGELLAADYVLAYEVADLDATRYAAVLELARQDAEEIGLAYLDGDKAAAVPWAGSRAQIRASARAGLGEVWNELMGASDSWTLDVEADASQGGKSLRLVLPAELIQGDRALRVAIDGQTLNATSLGAAADAHTLIVTVPIDHFSERRVQVTGLLPGVSALWQYVTIALGMALTVGGGFVGVTTLRSRAALRAFQEEARKETGAGPRSAAVARALGGPEPGAAPSPVGPEAEKAYKSALLRKLATQTRPPPGPGPQVQYDQCGRCGEPLRFYGDLAMVMCPKCGKANVNPRRTA